LETMKHFAVQARCGHVSTSYYVPILFAVRALSAKEAAEKTRWFPRVKHHHPLAVLDVTPIDAPQFYSLLRSNDWDPYLRCASIQDQRRLLPDMASRLVPEERQAAADALPEKNPDEKRYYHGKVRIKRNVKAYIRYCPDEVTISCA
jgi:hypothetical protein